MRASVRPGPAILAMLLLAGCATSPPPTTDGLPAPTPTATRSPMSTASLDPTASPTTSPTAIPTPSPVATPTAAAGPTLEPIDKSLFGEGEWEVIASEVSDGGPTRVQVLGAVRTGVAAAITCLGAGRMTVTLWVNPPAGSDPNAPRPTPRRAISYSVDCPTTDVQGISLVDLEGMYVTPEVTGPSDVRYRLLVGTRRR